MSIVSLYSCRSGCPSFDEWEFAAGQRPARPTYPDGAAPVIAHPKFKDIISRNIEPLYTPIPVGK